jgi:hypothetical protein
MNLAEVRTDAIRPLMQRLNQMTVPNTTHGAWYQAATLIGTAHDLVASHLAEGVPRTPEANERLVGPGAAAAGRTVTELIAEAVDASRELTHRAALSQKRRRQDPPIPTSLFNRIHTMNQAVGLCARATLWDLAGIPQQVSSLGTLEVAVPAGLAELDARQLSAPFAAFRVLRQLCHDQGRGLTPASPASMRDLALLGVRLNDPELPQFAYDDDRPIARLQRAHAADQINAARTAWSTAATELTTTVQGITKAPGPYGAAVQTLLDQPLSDQTRRALATALPALGRDAARTVETLASRGDLVTRQPIPLQARNTWRPITAEHAETIASRFNAAARASSRAAAALRDLQGVTSTRQNPTSQLTNRRQLPAAQQSRGVTR